MKKTNYRNVFKSDHLGVIDLEDLKESGSDLVFKIKEVRQEFGVKVAGKTGNFNIAYFEEKIKPLVVNAGNCATLRKLTGSIHVEAWAGLVIQLYIDPSVTLKGDVVGGTRINPNYKGRTKKELTAENKTAWNNAIAAYKRDGNFDKVEARMTISAENKSALIEAANNAVA